MLTCACRSVRVLPQSLVELGNTERWLCMSLCSQRDLQDDSMCIILAGMCACVYVSHVSIVFVKALPWGVIASEEKWHSKASAVQCLCIITKRTKKKD